MDKKDLQSSEVNERSIPQKLKTLFQPIVSIDDKQVIGFEAFSREVKDGEEQRGMNINDLFDTEDPAYLYDLDKSCCTKALYRFRKLLKSWGNISIFININVRALGVRCCEEHFISDLVKSGGVPLKNIVIEIASESLDEKNGLEFVEYCRGQGFQISIDKVEHDSRLLSILLQVKPDFIKLQRSIWSNPLDTTFNLGNLEYVVRNCTSVDCVPIALGIESEDEAMHLLQAKINCHQGYFYTRNRSTTSGAGDSVQGFVQTVELINSKFKQLQADRIKDRKKHFLDIRTQMKKISSLFIDIPEIKFKELLKRILRKYEDVVSIFVIDEHGIQVTPRLARNVSKDDLKQRRAVNTTGADHSMRDYYMHLLLGYDNFVTPPQLSPFTNFPTVIVSLRFFSGLKSFHLLCVEFPSG
ncbi:EAL domain-containing protein [Maridesulfovibrio sp.]|uniref:EAL domain-containing protein n=1 Tax=Maridesulfovibrio sp. TaxID=2795000 RepID=UPI003BAD867B